MKTAVICLAPSYFSAASHVSSVLADTRLYDDLPIAGAESDWVRGAAGAIVFVGSVPEAIGVMMSDPLFREDSGDGLSSAKPMVAVDGECRNVVQLTDAADNASSRLCAYLGGALGASSLILNKDIAAMWRLGRLASQFEWGCEVKGDIGEMQEYFDSFGPTALLLEVRDRGTRFLLSSMTGHVDLYYSAEDIADGAYRLVIAVSPKIIPDPKAPMIISYIPRCLVPVIVQPDGSMDPYKYSSQDNATDTSCCQAILDALDAHGLYRDSLARFVSPSKATPDETVPSGRVLFSEPLDEGRRMDMVMQTRFVRQGHIEVIEIDSFDPYLVTVRGAEFIHGADLLLFEADRTPREYRNWIRPESRICRLDEVTSGELEELIRAYVSRGLSVAWLFPPSLADDMQNGGPEDNPGLWLDNAGFDWSFTPGVR